MRGAILGSGATHALLAAFLLVVRPPVHVVVPGPDVVQVALVDPLATIAPAPPPAEVAKLEPKETVKPEEDTGIKLEKDRLKKKREEKKEEKKEEPPRPEPAPAAAPALPVERVGTAGLRGDLSVDRGGFEFTYYLVLVRNRIAANWTPPAGLSTGGNPVRAVVYFRVGRGGDVSAVQLETGSSVEFFDRSAMRAVLLSDPLPPLPLGFPGGELGVHFGFEWEAP